MSDFKIKVEEDTFWKEVKKEKIIGNVYCPVCKTTLILIPAVDLLIAYCQTVENILSL